MITTIRTLLQRPHAHTHTRQTLTHVLTQKVFYEAQKTHDIMDRRTQASL